MANQRTEQAPAFQFYVKEWRSSRAVMRMSFAERGMYLEMLLEQWEKFTLPDSPDECADLIGGTIEEWRLAWTTLRRKFVIDDSGRLYNIRLENVRRERSRFARKMQRVSRAGGQARARTGKRGKYGTYLPADEPAASQPSPASATDLNCTATDLVLTPTESVSSATPSAAEPPLLVFPTIGSSKTWNLTDAHLAEWRELYPELDVLGECRRALAYLRAKGPRTSKGMPTFLVNWFNRTVNNGGAKAPAQPQKRAEPWSCPHVIACSSRTICDNATYLGKPRKGSVVSI